MKAVVPEFVAEWIDKKTSMWQNDEDFRAMIEKQREVDGVTMSIDSCDSFPCSLRTFSHVNGVSINVDDFGDNYDADAFGAEQYCCGDHRFEPKLPTSEVLKKYDLDVEGYRAVCDELESVLHVGQCHWCS